MVASVGPSEAAGVETNEEPSGGPSGTASVGPSDGPNGRDSMIDRMENIAMLLISAFILLPACAIAGIFLGLDWIVRRGR